MTSTQNFDVCVIGAGPGGYVAAIRAAQLGKKTCIVEREYLGGVCLNVGCIPSKAMISAAHFLTKLRNDAPEMGIEIKGAKSGAPDITVNMKKLVGWKQSVSDRMASGVAQLLKGNSVTVIRGEAEFTSPASLTVKSSSNGKSDTSKAGADATTISAKNFVIATGSRPIEIAGFQIDEKNVLSSTGALALDEVPKSVVVIGGGYIGLEIGSYLKKLGSDVTVLEAGQALLNAVADKECVQVVERKLKKNGVQVLFGAKAKAYKKTGAQYEIEYEVSGTDKNAKLEKIKCDKILLMVGRRPNSDQTGLKKIGIALDERGFIKVNAQRRTNLPHIFAIGDIAGQPMLAHKASHEGVLVAEVIGGMNRAYDVKTVPAVVFTDPEIASVGLLESECAARGYNELMVSKFPFAANGRAVSLMETDGFVKIIADKKTHVILGVHMVGPEVSNLISEAALAIEMGARLEDLALTIHPHPTLGEVVMEAAEATLGHAIHIIQKPLAHAQTANGAASRAPVR